MLKVQLNPIQVSLVQSWLPSGSWPYAYDPVKGHVWYWQTTTLGPVKGCTRLSQEQINQLNQLN